MDPTKDRLVDLTSGMGNWTPGVTLSRARQIVRSGDPEMIGEIPGHFAIAEREERTVRLARTLGAPLRYFVGKRLDGPFLIVAETIEQIWQYCQEHRMEWQFDPAYTRMVPAHHLVELDQVGCPDPNPRYRRFFSAPAESGPGDVEQMGKRYVDAIYEGLRSWLSTVPGDEPIALAFSGGIDSTAVLVLARHALKAAGSDADRVIPCTLEVEGGGADSRQAGDVLREIDLEGKGEVIRVAPEALDLRDAVQTTEDYQPLDIQCAAALIALLRSLREAHPSLRYLLDGDGSDENLRSYPLKDSELTIHSVLKNPLLYLEGWGVDAIKHSLTYSGGLSRSVVRTWAPARRFGFRAFSPFTLRPAIREAMAIPLRSLVGEDPSRLYSLKGEILRAGVQSRTGVTIPVRPKRRFQEGVAGPEQFASRLACTKEESRAMFRLAWEERLARATSPRARAGA